MISYITNNSESDIYKWHNKSSSHCAVAPLSKQKCL